MKHVFDQQIRQVVISHPVREVDLAELADGW
jgi:hypothetical protein